jgi:hypothetical protein
MSDFGVLALLAEGAGHADVRDLAARVSPGLLIVADRPASDHTAKVLMSALRTLPAEVLTLSVVGEGIQDSSGGLSDAGDYYTENLVPLLLGRTQVVVVAPAGFLDAMLRSIDPARMEGGMAEAGGIVFGFDRRMRPRTR